MAGWGHGGAVAESAWGRVSGVDGSPRPGATRSQTSWQTPPPQPTGQGRLRAGPRQLRHSPRNHNEHGPECAQSSQGTHPHYRTHTYTLSQARTQRLEESAAQGDEDMGEAVEVEEAGGTQAQGGGARRGEPSMQQRNGGAGSNMGGGGSQQRQNGMPAQRGPRANGTQTEAADGSGVQTMRQEGTAGQLKKIRLDDFMCHKCFEMDFGWVDGLAVVGVRRPLGSKECLAVKASGQGGSCLDTVHLICPTYHAK